MNDVLWFDLCHGRGKGWRVWDVSRVKRDTVQRLVPSPSSRVSVFLGEWRLPRDFFSKHTIKSGYPAPSPPFPSVWSPSFHDSGLRLLGLFRRRFSEERGHLSRGLLPRTQCLRLYLFSYLSVSLDSGTDFDSNITWSYLSRPVEGGTPDGLFRKY